MIVEHVAFNVQDPVATARWYEEHLGLRTVFQKNESPFMRFLCDSGGRVVMELYNNPAAPVPDYAAQHHLVLHIAFVSENAEDDKNRLISAGATLVDDNKSADGNHLVMLRDPWGLALQLCQRAKPLMSTL